MINLTVNNTGEKVTKNKTVFTIMFTVLSKQNVENVGKNLINFIMTFFYVPDKAQGPGCLKICYLS